MGLCHLMDPDVVNRLRGKAEGEAVVEEESEQEVKS